MQGAIRWIPRIRRKLNSLGMFWSRVVAREKSPGFMHSKVWMPLFFGVDGEISIHWRLLRKDTPLSTSTEGHGQVTNEQLSLVCVYVMQAYGLSFLPLVDSCHSGSGSAAALKHFALCEFKVSNGTFIVPPLCVRNIREFGGKQRRHPLPYH